MEQHPSESLHHFLMVFYISFFLIDIQQPSGEVWHLCVLWGFQCRWFVAFLCKACPASSSFQRLLRCMFFDYQQFRQTKGAVFQWTNTKDQICWLQWLFLGGHFNIWHSCAQALTASNFCWHSCLFVLLFYCQWGTVEFFADRLYMAAALAALEFAHRKFSMVAKSRVRAVQLQLVHDQALHR